MYSSYDIAAHMTVLPFVSAGSTPTLHTPKFEVTRQNPYVSPFKIYILYAVRLSQHSKWSHMLKGIIIIWMLYLFLPSRCYSNNFTPLASTTNPNHDDCSGILRQVRPRCWQIKCFGKARNTWFNSTRWGHVLMSSWLPE